MTKISLTAFKIPVENKDDQFRSGAIDRSEALNEYKFRSLEWSRVTEAKPARFWSTDLSPQRTRRTQRAERTEI